MQSAGGLRVFDGLFVGDEHTARDEQFMLLNQITLVINLSSSEIRNYFEHYNIRYINLTWKEFTQQINNFGGLYAKINENLEREESVLIHRVGNLDESVTLTAVFIMKKFRWSLYKTLQYLQARIAHLTFSAVTFNLLKICQLKLLNSETRLSYNWEIPPDNQRQLVLRNTYLNSSKGQKNNKYLDTSSKKNKNAKRRVSWNIKQVSNPSERSSHRGSSQKLEEDSRRNRLILSVKKIIAQSVNKENKRSINPNNKGLNKNGEKLKLNKLTTQEESTQPMKKYKSFYSLASLPSFQKQQAPMTQQSQKSQINRLAQKLEKSTSQYSLKERIKTQKSQKYSENKSKVFSNKISLIKTENTDYLNLNQENILSSNSSEIISRESSFLLKKEKQNLSSVSKISLRKPTPRKKYQIALHK